MVALELRRCAMAAVAVDFDYHPAVEPDRIDEPPFEHHVDGGDGDAVALAQGEERVLELAAGVGVRRLVALQRLAKHSAAGSATAEHVLDRLEVQQIEVFGLGECVADVVGRGGGGEVQEHADSTELVGADPAELALRKSADANFGVLVPPPVTRTPKFAHASSVFAVPVTEQDLRVTN